MENDVSSKTADLTPHSLINVCETEDAGSDKNKNVNTVGNTGSTDNPETTEVSSENKEQNYRHAGEVVSSENESTSSGGKTLKTPEVNISPEDDSTKPPRGRKSLQTSVERAMAYEKMISLRDKEILALRENANLLEEKVALLENSLEARKDNTESHMRDVELEFMHKENDRITKEATNENTRLSAEIATLKETQVRMESERKDMKTELSREKDRNVALSDELANAKLTTGETDYTGSCECKNSNEHECDFGVNKEKVDSLNEIVNDLKDERVTLVTHAKKKEEEAGECSSQLASVREALETKLQEQKLLLTKTESVVAVKDELLEAKQEIIDHLKLQIGTLEKERLGEVTENTNLTSNVESTAPVNEIPAASNGVEEACEFIRVYAKTGVVMNGLLMWANIQRMTAPENEWKNEALKKFLKSEITDAKDSLWRICGDNISIPTKKRQGPSKSVSEIDDIAKALKSLAEGENLPMFIATAEMVKETPIYVSESKESESEREVMSKLEGVENSLKAILDSTKAAEHINMTSHGKTNDQKDREGETSIKRSTAKISWAQDEDVYLSESEDDVSKEQWSVVGESSKSKRRTWKDKLNILKGTLSSDNDDAPQPADVHLVAYGFGTDTSGEQLKQWLKSNGIRVKNCSLLTTFEGARSHTFKLVVKATDYEKTINPAIWPEKVGVRKFKFFGPKKRNTNGGNQDKILNPGDPDVIVHPERASDWNQRQRPQLNGNGRNNTTSTERDPHRLWNPPTKDLLMQYQKRFGPIGPTGNPPLQQQNIWEQPHRGIQQNNQSMQNKRIRKTQPQTQPQVQILQRNGNSLPPSQINQQMMQLDDAVMAESNSPVFSLCDDWSRGYQTQQ